MYVSEICAEGIFGFPLVTKNVRSTSKIALFSNERHFEIWFPKKKTITLSWSKLFKKRPNFACDNYIFPKTRTNSVPIPHPVSTRTVTDKVSLWYEFYQCHEKSPEQYQYNTLCTLFFHDHYQLLRALITWRFSFSDEVRTDKRFSQLCGF